MSQVIEQLAELTAFRDRDLLDVTLVGALKDVIRPRSLAIYRTVGEGSRRHWMTRARIGSGDQAASADSMWAELDSLPQLADRAAHQECLFGERVVRVPGPPALTLFPVCTDREPVGVLEIETDGPLPDEQQRLVCSILRIYRNFEALLDYSERDTLTGLLNRKTFDECFLRLSQRSSPPPASATGGARRRDPGGQPYFLGVIDIDHFKRVNDGFGHLIGDEVLLLMSRLMRASFRYHDHLFRFGGEEFVVLMRCQGSADAAAAFERMRVNVERYVFPRVGHITVSVGYTALRADDTPPSAFERADKAVYFAKQSGRNQVHDHSALVAAGKLADQAHASDVELF